MPKPLKEWVASEVRAAKRQPLRWLSERYFFRDPVRAVCADSGVFLSPADGVVLYARELDPDEPLLEIKGRNYTVRSALRDPDYAQRSLVVGIFMTAYDVHIMLIPMKPPLVSEMIAPLCSEMMSPPRRQGRAGYVCSCFVRAGRQASGGDLARRMLSPSRSRRWALWTSRSRMASA